jgi:hypothetical protein
MRLGIHGIGLTRHVMSQTKPEVTRHHLTDYVELELAHREALVAVGRSAVASTGDGADPS